MSTLALQPGLATSSPRAARALPGETHADALRRTADAPAETPFGPGASPRADAAQIGESFADTLRRTASVPIAPVQERSAPAPRAASDLFGRSHLDALRRSANLEMEPAGIDKARDAAEQLVAITFIQPVLANLRESNMAAEPFGPGDAERRFGPMWDAAIAHRMVKARGFGLVDAVARRVRVQGNGAASAAPVEDPLHAQRTAAALDAHRISSAIDLDG